MAIAFPYLGRARTAERIAVSCMSRHESTITSAQDRCRCVGNQIAAGRPYLSYVPVVGSLFELAKPEQAALVERAEARCIG
jgi:hypothetical protein